MADSETEVIDFATLSLTTASGTSNDKAASGQPENSDKSKKNKKRKERREKAKQLQTPESREPANASGDVLEYLVGASVPGVGNFEGGKGPSEVNQPHQPAQLSPQKGSSKWQPRLPKTSIGNNGPIESTKAAFISALSSDVPSSAKETPSKKTRNRNKKKNMDTVEQIGSSEGSAANVAAAPPKGAQPHTQSANTIQKTNTIQSSNSIQAGVSSIGKMEAPESFRFNFSGDVKEDSPQTPRSKKSGKKNKDQPASTQINPPADEKIAVRGSSSNADLNIRRIPRATVVPAAPTDDPSASLKIKQNEFVQDLSGIPGRKRGKASGSTRKSQPQDANTQENHVAAPKSQSRESSRHQRTLDVNHAEGTPLSAIGQITSGHSDQNAPSTPSQGPRGRHHQNNGGFKSGGRNDHRNSPFPDQNWGEQSPSLQNHAQHSFQTPTKSSWHNKNGTGGAYAGDTPANASSNENWRGNESGRRRERYNQTPNVQNGGTPGRNGGRQAVFEDYLPLDQVNEGIKKKSLLEGVLRINKRAFFDAYVTVDGLEDDIYIPGKYRRNRAFDGETVVVKILDGAELEKEMKRDVDDEKRRRDMEEERRKKVVLEDDMLEGGEDILESIEIPKEVRMYGKVVFIREKKEARAVIGTLHVDNPTFKGPSRITPGGAVDSSVNTIYFRPHDARVPFVVIPVEHAPSEFLKAPHTFTSTLWRATISRWPPHCQYPYGKVGGMMGLMGEIPVETESLLLENGITWSDFSDEVIGCLPPTPWAIPESEYAIRRDFRSTRIFSIDPATARDLDDALSIVPRPDGTFEVGVHIADVSHFVKIGNELDAEAQNRSTTVYLIQKAIPMLPRLLCEELCSLNPGVERLAFSVTWIMDSNAVPIGQPWFGKSVIKSCAKLSYDHAQALIEGKSWDGLPPVALDGGHTIEDIRADTLRLYNFSVKMRARRYEGGALSINSFKLWFRLDETGNPIHTGVYEMKDSNRMIEEFMLLANMAVAKKISDTFPESAMLRRHELPKPRPLKQFLDFARELGYPMDATTSQSFQDSFNAIDKQEVQDVLRQLAIKPMQRAKYFCTGLLPSSHWVHYALNVPMYTHFTSPIRRYCDLVVHRQLQAALDAEAGQSGSDKPVAIEPHDTTSVGLFSRTCNDRKGASKDAQDASQRLYLSVYLHTLAADPRDGIPLTGLEKILGKGRRGVIAEALVYKVLDRSFDVIVEQYGLEKRCWIEDGEGMLGCSFSKDDKRLTVFWSNDTGSVTENNQAGKTGHKKRAGKMTESLVSEMEGLKLNDTVKADHVLEADNDDDWETDDEDAKMDLKKNHVEQTPIPFSKKQNGVAAFTPGSQKKKSAINAATTISQPIRIFDKVPVVLVADISRSPPEIKVYLLHPNVMALHASKLQQQVKVISYDSSNNFSCPAIDDEAH
ncbi:hypothetical protein CcCBS67573_g00410 [Chytriomyces confervae]|uniref:DIS3-like exonuclease 2 n=1 Tax=Chytriomyces confervae TaxID=246404 RepID=A0A507FUK9_9FUNG|nr:hypothetical protein HDU80_008828 [Chytriomyces hyalinus]TPX78357.1 hypothetical protein CcCBS67573_g00410 [Chytriomyces confervae]